MTDSEFVHVAKDSFVDWYNDNVQRLSASVAFYTVMSLAPLVLILIVIAGFVFGKQAAEGALAAQVQQQVGPQGARIIQELLNWRGYGASGHLAIGLSALVLFISASAVFTEFQQALNQVWDVKPKPESAIRGIIRRRLFSFLMILAMGILLLASLLLTAVLKHATRFAAASGFVIPSQEWQALNYFASFAAVMVLFALVYRVVPDARIPWRGAWLGAAVSALLYTIGKEVIGWYLGRSTFVSAYGAAGSVVVLLIWIYYSTQIVFYGAEFAEVWVNEYDGGITPERHAVLVARKPRTIEAAVRRRQEQETEGEQPGRHAA